MTRTAQRQQGQEPRPTPVRPDRWTENARSVRAFLQENGALPEHGGGPLESLLAQWLDVQRRAAHRGRLKPERASILDRAVPGWRCTRDERWADNLAEAASGDTGVKTREWLQNQRRELHAGNLRADRIAALDAAVPGWSTPQDPSWDEELDRTAHWIHTHGAFPGRAASGVEGELHAWLTKQRTLAVCGRLAASKAEKLQELLPGWESRLESKWEATARAVEAHVKSTGQRPRVRVPEERQLGKWVATQRAALRTGSLSEDRRRWLDANVPGWAGEAA